MAHREVIGEHDRGVLRLVGGETGLLLSIDAPIPGGHSTRQFLEAIITHEPTASTTGG